MKFDTNKPIVLLTSSDPNHKRFGTGFIIYSGKLKDIYVLTCSHVVREIKNTSDIFCDKMVGEVIADGEKFGIDLCILKFVGAERIAYLTLNDNGKAGDKIIISGFQRLEESFLLRPLKGILGEKIWLESKISTERTLAWDLKIEDSFALQPGYSGSPIIQRKTGFVIGVISHRQGAGGKGIGISVSAIKRIWQNMPKKLLNFNHKRSIKRKENILSYEKISISKLPSATSKIYGRQKELRIIDNVFHNSNINILSITAWGGVGKTSLVLKWLEKMMIKEFKSINRIFAWSFFSQGNYDLSHITADDFLVHALKFFGDANTNDGSPWEKGIRLAKLIQKERNILILDGFEPLQYSPGEFHGFIKDRGVQALLKELQYHNPGLCIITTRVEIQDFIAFDKKKFVNINLEQLNYIDCRKLLKSYGINGKNIEIDKISNEYKGHALALSLLGRYLSVVHDGDIRKHQNIPKLSIEEKYGGHARRIMSFYENWFINKPEINILYLMGLFNRPIEYKVIEYLINQTKIDLITDKVKNISTDTWKYSINNLRELGLVNIKNNSGEIIFDCHPLIREHFGNKFERENIESYKKAHERLFKFYYKIQTNKIPNSLDEIEPLLFSFYHCCKSRNYNEALKIYKNRICQKDRKILRNKFGALSTNIGLLQSFIKNKQIIPNWKISIKNKIFIFCELGIDLRMIGRLEEADYAFTYAKELSDKAKIYNYSVNINRHLSQLYLSMGEINKAINFAKNSVNLSSKKNVSKYEKISSLCTLGDTLHHSGEYSEARKVFLEAERLQKLSNSKYQILNSLAGYRYCDYLLTNNEFDRVISIYKKINKWKPQLKLGVGKGLALLFYGRALMLKNRDSNNKNDYYFESKIISDAIDCFRNSGYQDYLCRALIARSVLRRLNKDFNSIDTDITEIKETAARNNLKLQMIDLNMELSWFNICKYNLKAKKEYLLSAIKYFKKSKKEIKAIGYLKKEKELKELKTELYSYLNEVEIPAL